MEKAKPKKIKSSSGIPLSVFSVGSKMCMLSLQDKKSSSSLHLSWSSDGFNFVPEEKKVEIFISENKKEKIKDCRNFSISSTPTAFVMTYERSEKKVDKLVVAKSKDLFEWSVKSEIEALDTTRSLVVYDKSSDLFQMYRDGLFVRYQSTRTLISWKAESLLLFTGRPDSFDRDKITLVGTVPTKEGPVLIYDASVRHEKNWLLQVGAVLLDHSGKQITWRSDVPIWQGVAGFQGKNDDLKPIGTVYFEGSFIVYWISKAGQFLVASFEAKLRQPLIPQYKIFEKFQRNPVIIPRPELHWEGLGTFNPGVFQDDKKVLHMFYRALGNDGISRIGYAESEDGLHWSKRLPYPVFEPHLGFGLPDKKKGKGPFEYNPLFYHSGGGWGGSEDPRVVEIEDRLYMTYVAFEGWHSVRMALTSISIDDFKKGKWNWKKPVLLSPPGEVNKNWVLFPEKIKGKFAVLHSIAPDVLIGYFDDPDDFSNGKRILSKSPYGTREGKWDYKVRGAGTPPLRTPEGWLVLYHATEKKEPDKYKLGAMILDIKDPTKVLYRSNHAILYPDMWYENDGKPGVVYASGAVIRGKDLYIYYGGGDKVVCTAKTDLKRFLNYLVTGKPKDYELQKGGLAL